MESEEGTMTDLSKKFLAKCERLRRPWDDYLDNDNSFIDYAEIRPLIELVAKVIEEAEAIRIGFKLRETLDALREEVERE